MATDFFLLPNANHSAKVRRELNRQAGAGYNVSVLRKLRATHGHIPPHVEDFILQREGGDTSEAEFAWTHISRWGTAISVLVATLCAPLAILVVLAQMSESLGLETINDIELLEIVRHLMNGPSTHVELLGYLAAGSMIFTFSAKSPIILRLLGLMSNVLFISYAAALDLLPVLMLHGFLLPLNLRKLYAEIFAHMQERARKRYRIQEVTRRRV